MLYRKLLEMARAQDKILTFLDTSNYMELADCFNRNEAYYLQQVSDILDGKAGDSNQAPDVLKLAEAYREGDAQKIRGVNFEEEKCVLQDRNEQWAPKVGRILESYRTPFI